MEHVVSKDRDPDQTPHFALFKHENAVFNDEQEKESIICVRKG